MARNKPGSWVDYINTMQSRAVLPEQLKIDDMERMLNTHHHSGGAFYHALPFIYLMDYTTGGYPKTSRTAKALFGYEPHQLTDGGIAFTLDKYHKDDMRLFNEQIFPDRLAILKKIPPEEHHKYIFSYSFRFRNIRNEYVNVMQRNCFIKSDAKGGPLMSLGILTSIDHFRTSNPVIQVVEKMGGYPGEAPEIIYKKAFYLNEEDKLFTAREKEVLLWTADGLTSREIAEKLCLSENTIINHRRNMQTKSNTKNVVELVSFAHRQHII